MSNVTLETVSTIPDNFIGGGFTHIAGVWATNSIGDNYIADVSAKQIAKDNEDVRTLEIDTEIEQDTVINQLRAMTKAEFNTWWNKNVTNAAEAIAILKRLTFREIGRS